MRENDAETPDSRPTPKVSVVVPIHGTEDSVETCVRSIMGQTLRDIEILCVDDCSPDDSAAIIERLAAEDPRIRLIRHERNLGLGGARNTGIEAARAPYVAGVDSDDYILPEMLETLWRATENQSIDIVVCAIALEYPGDKKTWVHHVEDRLYRAEDIAILHFLVPSFCARLWRTRLFTGTGIRFPEHTYYEDLATSPRLLHHASRIRTIDLPFYRYVQREGSITNSTGPRHIIDYFRVFDVLADFLRDEGLAHELHHDFVTKLSKCLHHHGSYVAKGTLSEDEKKAYLRHMLFLKFSYLEHRERLRETSPSDLVRRIREADSGSELPADDARVRSGRPSVAERGSRRFRAGSPKVSVIVPIFDTEKHVEKCIRSVLSQTLTDIEVLCIDDASNDGSAAVVEQLAAEDDRVRLIRHRQQRGPGGARNSGLDAARGAYVTCVDSDDTILPDMLERLWEGTDAGSVDVVASGIDFVHEGEPAARRSVTLRPGRYAHDAPFDVLEHVDVRFCGKLWRTDLFDEAGIRFPEHACFEDIATVPRLLWHAREVGVIAGQHYRCLVRPEALSSSTGPRHILDIVRTLELLDRFVRQAVPSAPYPPELTCRVGDILTEHALRVGASNLDEAQRAQYLRLLLMAKLGTLEHAADLQQLEIPKLLELMMWANSPPYRRSRLRWRGSRPHGHAVRWWTWASKKWRFSMAKGPVETGKALARRLRVVEARDETNDR